MQIKTCRMSKYVDNCAPKVLFGFSNTEPLPHWKSLSSLTWGNPTDIPSNRDSLWQRIVQLKQHFRQCWSSNYLNDLQQREKWKFATATVVTPRTLVILKGDHLPPLIWKLGQILELHSGSDGQVVSVKINCDVSFLLILYIVLYLIWRPLFVTSVLYKVIRQW